MSLTRRQLLTRAYRCLGVSNEFDVSPDELTTGVEDMNMLMAAWTGRNIRIGYRPGTGLDDQTGIPDVAEGAVAMNLALRLAPSIGKAPSPDLKRDARLAYLALLTNKVRLTPVQLPQEMPLGAGNRRFVDRRFISPPTDPFDTGAGGTIDDVEFE